MIGIERGVTKEAYEIGLNCRGLCFICDASSNCYQYKINKQKELIKKFTDEELFAELNRRLKREELV